MVKQLNQYSLRKMDIYEQLRYAHNNLKNIGGNVMGKVVTRTAMIDKVGLSDEEKNKAFKLVGEIRNRLYKLEKMFCDF